MPAFSCILHIGDEPPIELQMPLAFLPRVGESLELSLAVPESLRIVEITHDLSGESPSHRVIIYTDRE